MFRERTEAAKRLVGAGGFEPPKLKSNRFTVCPIWPLWNAPNYSIFRKGGAGGRIRTPDLLITNQLLYQLSYTSEISTPVYYITAIFDCQVFF